METFSYHDVPIKTKILWRTVRGVVVKTHSFFIMADLLEPEEIPKQPSRFTAVVKIMFSIWPVCREIMKRKSVSPPMDLMWEFTKNKIVGKSIFIFGAQEPTDELHNRFNRPFLCLVSLFCRKKYPKLIICQNTGSLYKSITNKNPWLLQNRGVFTLPGRWLIPGSAMSLGCRNHILIYPDIIDNSVLWYRYIYIHILYMVIFDIFLNTTYIYVHFRICVTTWHVCVNLVQLIHSFYLALDHHRPSSLYYRSLDSNVC